MTESIPSITRINKNFVIKWRNHGEPDTGEYNRLIGAGKFEELFGEHYKEKYFNKAWESPEKKTVFRIRGKYVITFVAR